MAAELRDEFENYVKKLTTEISKKIFLKKLEDLYSQYKSEGEKYAALTARSESACSQLEQEVKIVDKSFQKMETEMQSSLKTISDDIGTMEASTNELFAKMKTMDDQNRKRFITELSYYIEKYKGEVAKTFTKGCEEISDKLAGVITPEILQQFMDALEEHTRETKEIASFINETYKADIEQNIRFLIESNLKAQRQTQESLSADMTKLVGQFETAEHAAEMAIDRKAKEFSDSAKNLTELFAAQLSELAQMEKSSRDEAIRRQMELIAKIGPSEEKINRFQREVEDLHRTVEYLQSENMRNYTSLRETLEDFMEEQRETEQKRYKYMESILTADTNRGWRIYVAATNTLMLLCFGMMVYAQTPWAYLELWETALIAGAFVLVILVQTIAVLKLGKKKKMVGIEEKNGDAAGAIEDAREEDRDGR